MKKYPKSYKKVPSYWWDFEDSNLIIVESDHKDYPIVAQFPYENDDATEAIEQAMEYIDKLEKGHISPKSILPELKKIKENN